MESGGTTWVCDACSLTPEDCRAIIRDRLFDAKFDKWWNRHGIGDYLVSYSRYVQAAGFTPAVSVVDISEETDGDSST